MEIFRYTPQDGPRRMRDVLYFPSTMGLFRKKKEEHFEGMLGVDIGTSGIKIVELTPDHGRVRLSTYGYSEPASGTTPSVSLLDNPVRAAEVLQQVMKTSHMKARKAVASLPSAKVFQTLITLPAPKDSKEDFKALIESQARKLLPLPLEEIILDSNVLDKDLLPEAGKEKGTEKMHEPGDQKKYIRVLLTGAPKVLVSQYVDIFRRAKLDLVSLETETFALARSLVGKDRSRIMLVDIGAMRTNVSIVDKGIPYLARGIKSGGDSVTQALAASTGVSFEEAEAMKRDLAYKSNQVLPPPLEAALQPIVHEMKYALQLYAEQGFHENNSVEKIVVTGGSSHVPGLAAYVSSALNVNVYIGDPWARIATQPEARPILDEVGPRLAVAIGLAMRGREE